MKKTNTAIMTSDITMYIAFWAWAIGMWFLLRGFDSIAIRIAEAVGFIIMMAYTIVFKRWAAWKQMFINTFDPEYYEYCPDSYYDDDDFDNVVEVDFRGNHEKRIYK